MLLKKFLQPDKYKIITFLLLFTAIFLIPYLEAKPSPGLENLIAAGHYPLIFVFLLSLVAIADLAAGNFSPGGLFLCAGFIFSFALLYFLAAGLSGLLAWRRPRESGKTRTPDEAAANDRLIIRFDDK